MKRHLKLITSVLLIIFLTTCSSSTKENQVIDLLPVCNGNIYRYINPGGKIIINPQFKESSVFRDKLALVQIFGTKPSWGFITEDGNFAIKATYKEATVFSEGIAWVISEFGAPQAISSKGDTLFKLPQAKSVRIFKNGLAAFSISMDSLNQKWGFVDKNGTVKISPQYSTVRNFSDGKCAVANAAGEWGYIDATGKQIINYQYTNAGDFESGKAIVSSGRSWGVIDETGKYAINPTFQEMRNDNADQYLVKQNNKWGWCNQNGKMVIEPQFSDVEPFGDNDLAPVKQGDKWGYINKSGKMIIDPQFDSALPFNGNIAWAMIGGKGGFIDNKGKYVIQPLYDGISDDYKSYVLTGSSKFETVTSDYFDSEAIINRLKKDITINTVAGLNFSSSLSVIYAKFKKTEADFNKSSSEHKIIAAERLSNDATLDFFLLGNPWNEKYNGNFGFSYTLKPSYKHVGFTYRIKVTGKSVGREAAVLKSMETVLSGYTKDVKHSGENVCILQSKSQLIVMLAQPGIIIVAIYPVTPENLEMVDLNYGNGMDADSTAVSADSLVSKVKKP
jgi:hypothetical protein